MRGDRQMVLQMVALGRLSPAEAERLLLAWNEGRETAWVIAGCLALALIGHAGALAHLSHVVSLASQVLGRVL